MRPALTPNCRAVAPVVSPLANVLAIQAERLRVGTGRADDLAQAKAAHAGARIRLFLERARQASDGDAPRQSANTATRDDLALNTPTSP